MAAGTATSASSFGFAPLMSVMKILTTIADEAAGLACAFRQMMEFNLDPFTPAVNKVTKVPEPSLAVLAAATDAKPMFGVSVNIGVVFGGMNYLLFKSFSQIDEQGRGNISTTSTRNIKSDLTATIVRHLPIRNNDLFDLRNGHSSGLILYGQTSID